MDATGSTPGLGYLKLLSSNLMTNKIQMFETEIKLSSRKICPGPGSYSLDLDLSRDRSRIFDLQSVLSSSLFSLDQNIIIDLLTYYKILHHRFLHVFRIIVFFQFNAGILLNYNLLIEILKPKIYYIFVRMLVA